MKPRLLSSLLPSLLLGSAVTGCATDDQAECLPGDIDCAPDDGGDLGKGDGWDYKNDPARMSQRLNYRLAELPKKGKLETPVWKAQYPNATSPVAWADTYWPTYEGSHNARWQGRTIKSPAEKYDLAFNNHAGCESQPTRMHGPGAKEQWDTYYGCAGPAAKWQSKEFQGGGRMHDGIDNDGDGKIDDYNADGDVDGIGTWWGTCHAWAPASLVVPEPQRAVTHNGVTFEIADIKALIQNIYDGTSAVMLGGRCNAREVMNTSETSANHECGDVNPGSLHVIMTNFLGIAQLALIEDRTANFEVWNQGVLGYEVTKQAKVTNTAANACVGASGNRWTYNPDAKDLYEVRMTVTYLTEGHADRRPLGFSSYTRTDDYHYILETNADGKVIGGRYCTDSQNTHVDFLWAPTGNHRPSNPHINTARVKELIAKSVAPEDNGGGTTPGGSTFTATPNAAIPDNNPAGVTIDIPVSGVSGPRGLTVSVDITHTYRGDLQVDLLKDGNRVKTLHARTGGSADDLVQSYTLTPAEVGTPNGTWALKVSDHAAWDTGKVNAVTLTFQ